MQNNVVFLRENNPIIAYHLQLMLEEEGFIVIKIDKNEHFMILCQYYKPIFIIWNEDGQITKKQAQSLAAMRADSGIPLFAIKSLETKENNLLHDFMLYDKILYKPFSCVQLKHFLTHLPKISPSFSLPL